MTVGSGCSAVASADDQAMVRSAFASLLDLEPDLQFFATAEDGDDALAAVREHMHAGDRVEDPLTARDVLRLAGDGHPNAEIAARLHLADGTVRNYLSTALAKLGARNRTEAARLARERGWL